MKTALGYFFLALGATFAGVVLTVLFFVVRGKLYLLDNQMDVPFQRVAMTVYGIKWIKRDVHEEIPPTGERAMN